MRILLLAKATFYFQDYLKIELRTLRMARYGNEINLTGFEIRNNYLVVGELNFTEIPI